MIRHTNGEPILGVEYDLVWEGETLDTIGPEQGGMSAAIAKVEKNPGMQIRAKVFHNLGESEDYARVEMSSRIVYPVVDARAA